MRRPHLIKRGTPRSGKEFFELALPVTAFKRDLTLAFGLAAFLVNSLTAHADVLCKVKKTGAVLARPTSCSKKEIAIATLATTSSSSSTAADITIGSDINVQDSGVVSSGSDSTIGVDLNVSRLNATGGIINTTGMNLSVIGDAGGDSTNVGLSVETRGADNNYCALFQGGNVGINVSDPDEALEIAGRIHLGDSTAPADSSGRLYNLGGNLYWNGRQLNTSSSSETLTGVTAGSGLVGGGTSGTVSIAVDTGTTAGKLIQLNASGELPAVSGKNLSSLNASNLDSGLVSDARLSANVSLLGSSIGLTSEVSGVLPIANGGTGSTSFGDLVSLGAHTVGNYVASIAGGTGVSVSPSAAGEGSSVTLSIDTASSPTWSALHSFVAGLNVGTSTASSEILHLNGRLHLEPGAVPSVTNDKLYNVGGNLFFNGLNISQQAAGGDITGVTAGTGLTGGGTSGAVTLAIDTGTAANNIVQLNGSAQLPAVSGANLTTLNATNISSGTISDSRLSGNVSLLGPSISLNGEVTGTLPVSSGGTGAATLNDLITLGTHTTGSYVASVTAGSGLSLNTTGTEGVAATYSLNQAFSPVWTAQHTFSGVTTDITTSSNEDFVIDPNGSGKIGLGTSSPGAFLDSSFGSTSTTGTTEIGSRFTFSDTGVVSSGTDITVGVDVNLSRTGGSGGIQESRGLQVTVTGDTGGAATTSTTGIDVLVSGGDTNYAALLNGGRVGIGTTTPSAILDTVFSSAANVGATEVGNEFNVTDSGAIASGSDTTIGLDMNVARSGASGGTITTTGIDIAVTDDGGGTSTTTALRASATGGDSNYAAIFPSGYVGIGTASPSLPFDFTSTFSSTTAATRAGASFATTNNGIVTTGTDSTNTMMINSVRTGATGGTINNTALSISASGETGTAAATLSVGLDVTAAGADNNVAATFTGGSVGVSTNIATLTDSDIPAGSLVVGAGALCVDDNNSDCGTAGRIAGNVYAEGASITGIDLAEEFPIREGDDVQAGDIIIADTQRAAKCVQRGSSSDGNMTCERYVQGYVPFVTRSSGLAGESKRVLGIVSTEPGVTLGGFKREELIGYKKVPLALAGRVPVKVNDENGPIEIGDRIAPSSAPGVGKRAQQGEISVGVALEPLESGSGSIVVLVGAR